MNAYAGMQQKMIVEYNWIDRLIQWGQSNIGEVFVFGLLVAVILYFWKRK